MLNTDFSFRLSDGHREKPSNTNRKTNCGLVSEKVNVWFMLVEHTKRLRRTDRTLRREATSQQIPRSGKWKSDDILGKN